MLAGEDQLAVIDLIEARYRRLASRVCRAG